MNTSELIKNKRKEKHLTMKKVAEYVGVSEATVSRWESGNIANMGRDKIAKLSEVLDISPSVIAGYAEEATVEFAPYIQAPLFASVSAGFGSTREEPLGTFPCVVRSKEEANNTLCVTVAGDSMTPKIENGDILQVRKQTSVDSGDIAVVLLDDMEHLVKKVEYGTDYIRLISLNANYTPIILKGSDVQRCRVQGKVISITKRV